MLPEEVDRWSEELSENAPLMLPYPRSMLVTPGCRKVAAESMALNVLVMLKFLGVRARFPARWVLKSWMERLRKERG
jgi:hypothetical protein